MPCVPAFDPQTEALLEQLGAVANSTVADLAAQRESWPASDPALLAPRPLADVCELVLPTEPPVAVRIYTPVGQPPRAVIVWLHPGGFVAGHLDDIDGVCRALAEDSDATVMSVAYRLAPEHPYPAAVDDVTAVLTWLHDHAASLGLDCDRIGVGGQSAGATLAAAACLRLRDEGRPLPVLQVLAYPVLDPALAAPSYVENDGKLFTRAQLSRDWELYLGERRERPPAYAAPLLADDLGGLPPALVLAAGHDPARDDSRRYAQRLREAGVDCELLEYPSTIHAFLSFAGVLGVAREALEVIADRLRVGLGPVEPCLHHVGLSYPPEAAMQARDFYRDLLGLRELRVPAALADRPFLWFSAGAAAELHLIPERVVRVAGDRHTCLAVASLDGIAAGLEAAGHTVERYVDIVNRPQAFVRDPFGNLLELTELHGAPG